MKFIVIFSLLIYVSSYAGSDETVFEDGFELIQCISETVYTENFNIANQNAWPFDWQESGTSIEVAEVLNNQGRLVPLASQSPYSLGRIDHPLNEVNLDVTFSFEFEDATNQGIGFYVRSNGGFLVNTNPMGQGYAVFLERFASDQSRLGLWYEHDGIETAFIREPEISPGVFYDFLNNTQYNVRFQVFQESATHTRLRAKVWLDGTTEPSAWGVSHLDDYAVLQNLPGSIAVDSFNTQSNGVITTGIKIDQIVVSRLCNPVLSMSLPVEIANGLQFAEGPVWKDDFLLISDIETNTIYRWQENSGLSIFNSNSGNANGLFVNNQNELLAAEHGNRRVSITDDSGTISLVDNYQGNLFNSPNDVVVSSNNVVYFTDPDYGLNGRPRELAFNGVFRLHPTLGLMAEYQGDAINNKPNGIILSKNESHLFWSDTQTGTIHKLDVGLNGELSNNRNFVTNLTIPDGMCVDNQGNVYIATWNNALEVYTETGNYWGSISLPETAITNCTFGGQNNDELFITGRNSLYRSQPN